ncbi:MAG: class II aldolase/adducin family protein [Clostridiales bacterium]|nr:class II aldolase/adducin family protein [Clostridiales bacterium]
MKSPFEIKKEICEVGLKLWQKGFVAANDGNISVKVSDNEFYCTPTGVSKASLTPDMIIKVDKDGKKLEGKLNPSSEIKMHMRVYRERPDVTAVVHAHPPVATAFTVADIDLDQYVLPEAVLTIGAVPTCDYGTPSTMEIPDSLDPYIHNHDAFLLRNHGALTVGCNLTKAFFVMEEVEFNAVICKHAMDLGAVHEISSEQLKKLMDLRKKMNLPGRHPGIEYEEEASACNCSKEELVEAITKKVLAALGK